MISFALLRLFASDDSIHLIQDGGIFVALLSAAVSYGALKADNANIKTDSKLRDVEVDNKFKVVDQGIKEISSKINEIHTSVAILVSNEQKREAGLLRTRLDDDVSR